MRFIAPPLPRTNEIDAERNYTLTSDSKIAIRYQPKHRWACTGLRGRPYGTWQCRDV